MCQCPLFKQFTTRSDTHLFVRLVFILCVNVLFLSNSQLNKAKAFLTCSVYLMCQCPLFKQFTTSRGRAWVVCRVFILCVNVLFLSNSQPEGSSPANDYKCLSYVSMSSF